MLKTIGVYIFRTLVVLLAVALVAGAAYWFVPTSGTTQFGGRDRGRGGLQANIVPNAQQFENRPTNGNFAPRGDFEGERGGREGGFSLGRGIGQFVQYTILLLLTFGAVVLGLEVYRRLPWRTARAKN